MCSGLELHWEGPPAAVGQANKVSLGISPIPCAQNSIETAVSHEQLSRTQHHVIMADQPYTSVKSGRDMWCKEGRGHASEKCGCAPLHLLLGPLAGAVDSPTGAAARAEVRAGEAAGAMPAAPAAVVL